MRGRAPILLAVVLVALGSSPAAAPHGGGAARGFTSTITSIAPPDTDVDVAILEGDDRVQLRAPGDAVVIVHGYEGEDYLRFDATGVYRNTRSPATYLNDDRYGKVELPEAADPRAEPVWERVAPAGRAYDWHDHRIHWMSRSDPPVVVADRGEPHRIFLWTIPGSVDGTPLAIQGRLDYAPVPGQRFPRLLAAPLAMLALLAVALPLWRRHRSRGGLRGTGTAAHEGKDQDA